MIKIYNSFKKKLMKGNFDYRFFSPTKEEISCAVVTKLIITFDPSQEESDFCNNIKFKFCLAKDGTKLGFYDTGPITIGSTITLTDINFIQGIILN